MKKEISGLQEWLIAVALFIVIPTTVYLGCNLLSPKIDSTAYWKAHNEFFEGFNCKDTKKCQARGLEWKETIAYKEYQEKQCKRNLMYLMVAGPLSCAFMYIGTVFVMPIVSSSLVLVSLVLMMMYGSSYKSCSVMYGVGLLWFEMLFVFVSLLVVLYASYRSSEE